MPSTPARAFVHLFVFDGMSDWEYGFAIAGIHNPQFQRTPGRFAVRTVGPSTQPVNSAGGLRISPAMALDQLKPTDSAMLLLPGGALWDQQGNAAAAALAAEFLAQRVPVAAICGATAGLARAGLLDARPHTSNSKDYLAQTGYRGAELYRDAPTVVADGLITASAMHPLEFARDIFAVLQLYTDEVLAAWYGLYKTGDARYFATLGKTTQG